MNDRAPKAAACRRLRDLLHEEDFADQWYTYLFDRQLRRARELLAAEGIRVD